MWNLLKIKYSNKKWCNDTKPVVDIGFLLEYLIWNVFYLFFYFLPFTLTDILLISFIYEHTSMQRHTRLQVGSSV